MPTDLPTVSSNERALRKPGSMELDPTGEGLATDETARLIASDKVQGTAVYDRAGRHLGAVHNFMVDKVSGQVAYAVLAFGGFLGLGEDHHPLPWRALSYSTELGGYVVDIDPGALSGAPSRGPGEEALGDPGSRGRAEDDCGACAPTA